MANHHRPTFLNLALIRFPANAIVSALHRISGVILSLLVPVLVYLLDLSLQDSEGFAQVIGFFNNLGVKLLGVVALWALLHHIFAGIRFLLFDIHVGVKDYRPSWSARIANVSALVVTLFIVGVLW
ncbi:succinate dehydrogenase, cytochrome b556 subunit [Nitrosococcus wardiae]|uniref:Succinate dehydrogenase cytochrome b556 subunit n=1 Tax=Nitrosococcus wardiae TaxID=1814290 RepID=A0A4P7BXL4_9GAMM|nr:succinate dehydrogenase, cytochrome b556 subunit [Nitrosococcus wardiae]QBQ53192.1 succinate dehydrogenase, cytochrome b556 subunit [Nitrosococcus wardiae]